MAQRGPRSNPSRSQRPTAPRSGAPNPRFLDLMKRAGMLINSEQPDLAFPILDDALKLEPNHPDALLFMGRAHMLKQHWPEAQKFLRRAAAKRPLHVDTLIVMAQANDATGDTGKGDNAMNDLIAAYPSNPRVIAVYVHRLQVAGRAEEAYALLKRKLDSGLDDPMVVGSLALICRVTKRNAEGIDAARSVIERLDVEIATRRSAMYALGHMLDAEGEYDEAFKNFKRANDTMDAHPAVEPETLELLWDDERNATTAASPVRTEIPIFVVGMPRSGTTITEQILAAHPLVETVGECDLLCRLWTEIQTDAGLTNPARMQAAGATYLDRLKSVSRPGTTRVVDKMPENYFYLGFAENITPGAHIVHCHRHPIDTCLSNYFQDFGDKVIWSRRLDIIAKQYRTYALAMERYEAMIKTPILDWPNHKLVEDPSGQATKLLDHVGLSHDDRCINFKGSGASVRTASASQVREGVRKKKQARWKNYENHIGPLMHQLRDHVDAYEAKYAL